MSYKFYPKRPVKSFQDLEVYQKALAICVVITKRIPENDTNPVTKPLHECVLALPLQIASAHSIRFNNSQLALTTLERAMLNCNKTIVYLEQYRDIYNKDIEQEFFEEQVKNLLDVRGKILRLQFSWKKFMEEKSYEKK